MTARAWWWLSFIPGVAAYLVMPDGPWYRQLSAGFLVVLSEGLRRRAWETGA